MTINQWLHKAFGPRTQGSRALRCGKPRQLSRHWYRPRLEILEERLAPTVNLYYLGSGVLDVQMANSTSAPAKLLVSASNGQVAIAMEQALGNLDTGGMSFPSGTPTGWSLINITASPTDPTIIISLLTTPAATISNLNISAPGGATDTADTVQFGNFSLTSSSSASLSVSAGTINFAADAVVHGGSSLTMSAGTINLQSGIVVDATGSLTASATTINFQGGTSVPYVGKVTVNATYPLTGAYAGDQPVVSSGVDWTKLGFEVGDAIRVAGSSAGYQIDAIVTTTSNNDTLVVRDLGSTTLSTGTSTTDIVVQVKGAVVSATNSVNLTSPNSLTFQSTGVPYLGSVKINDGPPTGQPFAGDPYITGPDWGSYGYAPGDSINIMNAGTLSSGPYIVYAIIGHNLYLDSSANAAVKALNGANLSGNFTNVTVQCSGFTPEIQSASVNLNVTNPGSTISGAVNGTALTGSGAIANFVLLNATTNNGNITIQDLPPAGAILTLGTLNAGTGTIQLAVNGTVLSGAELYSIFNQLSGPNPYSSYQNVINLTAGAVDLTTTGSGSAIGDPNFPITTQSGSGQSLKLTAATNDGPVIIQDHSAAGLTINSIVADQKGQAPTVDNGQVVFNSTPNSSPPTYISGDNDVAINIPTATYTPVVEPVVVNSISATGHVLIYGEYILEGNAQSPNIIAQSVVLAALGFAEYKGQVTFAQASTGDTLTLPNGELWSNQFFFNVADNTIVVSGALSSADDGVFTIASISGSTLTLTQKNALVPEQDIVTVGDGTIGLPSAPISLSDVPLFLANTSNGNIYLSTGIDSAAEYANAGGGPDNNMANDVSVTSQADFLTVEGIFATGAAAVTMNSGALVEANGGTFIDFSGDTVQLSGIISGQTVSLTSPYNIGTASTPLQVDAASGLVVNATATSPSSAGIYIDDIDTSALTSIEVGTYDGSVTINSAGGGLLSFANSVLSEQGTAVVDFANMDNDDGSAGDVIVSGTVHVSSIMAGISADGTAGAGQILTDSTNSGLITGIGGPSSMIMLLAGSGIGSNPTTPVEISNVARLDASTNTGGIYVANGGASSTLTLSASALAGDVDVNWNGTIDLGSELSNAAGVVLPSISATGTVTLDSVGGAIMDQNDSTVSAGTLSLTASAGIGTASSPLKTTSRGTLTLTASAGNGGLFLDSRTALTVDSATAGNGDLSISAAGNLTLLGQGTTSVADATGNVTLTATAGALATGNITTSILPLTTTGQQMVTPIVMEPYITPGAALLIDTGANQEMVTVTAVTATTFTATFAMTHAANFTISTANSKSPASVAPIGAGTLTITAEQIGSPNDVIQTNTTTINATANYGGIYLGNDNSNPLTLTAAAVGTSSSGVAPNNITISSKGNIVLVQQSTALTQLATPVPVAIFTPGGALNLFAGYTLSADGTTPPTLVNPSKTITSTTTPPTATSVTLNAGQVASVSVSPGTDGTTTAPYTTAPTVTFTGGSGSGATGIATMSVSGLAITSSGSGYAAGPLPLIFSGGGGTGAAGTATISNGMVVSVSITNGGSGYTSAPAWSVSGGTTRATGTTILKVTGITVTNGGSGYTTTSPPTVTISPPGDDIYTGTYDINGYDPTSINPPPPPSFLTGLVIISNTQEVSVSPRGTTGIPALITLADLTTLAAQTNGNGTVAVPFGTETVATTNGITTVTITAAAITIDDLGQDGSDGTAIIPGNWSLDLEATGSIVFLDLGDTIATTGTGTITVNAGPSKTAVAALGNLTTGGGAITVSAGGNIGLGTLTAGNGTLAGSTVSVTSTFGAILFSTASTPTSPNVIASATTLTQHTQPVPSTQSVALTELHATQVIAAADAAYAQAVAAADAAGAQAAAELASANAFQAALTSIQAAVAADNRTYQADQQITAAESSTVSTDTGKVSNLTKYVTRLNDAAGSFGFLAAVATEIAAGAQLAASADLDVPIVGEVSEVAASVVNLIAATIGLVSASISAAGLQAQSDLNDASNTLNTDSGYLATDQSNEDQAAARLQADMDTETAFAAAYDVAKQAYTSSQQAYTNDQTASAQVQAQGDTNQAIAIAGVVFASPPQPINSTGSVSITGHSPLTVPPTTGSGPIKLTAMPEAGTSGDDLTVPSGVTVQSTDLLDTPDVTLVAGDNVVIQSGATIEGATTIAITANGNDDPNGATVTVAGTLSAQSASIGVNPGAMGNETFNIAPSAATPISVDGGSHSGGANTLNIDAEGLPVTISGGTITVGTLAPVTFTNIQVVNITNGGGSSFTLDGTSGAANTMSLVGTGQEAGTATLDGVAFSFSGMTSFSYQGGSGDTIAVTPFNKPNVPWNLAVTVAGGTGSPASLTYNAAAPDVTVTGTRNNAGTVVEPGVATVLSSNISQVTVAYQGIQSVETLPNLTVSDASGIYNGKAFSATVQVNGDASLDGITPTLTYYRGTLLIPAHQLTGAPIAAGGYTVVAAFAGDASYASASASTTFTIAPGTPQVSVNPVYLGFGTALADSQLSGTATFIVNGTQVNIPGTYSYTSAAGTVLAASPTPFTEAVTFTPNDTINYVTQTNLSVMVTVAGPLNKFVFSAVASPQTAGTPFTVAITAEDAYGNAVTGFTGSVQIMSNATLFGSPVTSTSFVNGVDANQSVTFTSAQSVTTLTADDGSGHTGTSNAFTVNPGSAALDELGAYRASDGSWSLDSNGKTGFQTGGPEGEVPLSDRLLTSFSPAGANIIPVAGDWAGLSISEIGDFRNGTWHLDLNNNGKLDAGETFTFGTTGDVPVPGHYLPGGGIELAVFRSFPAQGFGEFIISDKNWLAEAQAGQPIGVNTSFIFGASGDRVVVGDWSGGGLTEVGVLRDAAAFGQPGNAVFTLDVANHHAFDSSNKVFIFGKFADNVVIGDWDGSGTSKVGTYRPASSFGAPNTAVFSLDEHGQLDFNKDGNVFLFGLATDKYVTGRWAFNTSGGGGAAIPGAADNADLAAALLSAPGRSNPTALDAAFTSS